MAGLSGVPNRTFPTLRGPVLHESSAPAPEAIQPLNFKVPEGADTVADGVTVTYELIVTMKVTLVIADIPRNCTGRIELDGSVIHRSDDGEGSTGHVPLGDMTAGLGQTVSKIRVVLTNSAGASRNIRYWVQGFA